MLYARFRCVEKMKNTKKNTWTRWLLFFSCRRLVVQRHFLHDTISCEIGMDRFEFYLSFFYLHEKCVTHSKITYAIHAHLCRETIIRIHFEVLDLLTQSQFNALLTKDVHLQCNTSYESSYNGDISDMLN